MIVFITWTDGTAAIIALNKSGLILYTVNNGNIDAGKFMPVLATKAAARD